MDFSSGSESSSSSSSSSTMSLSDSEEFLSEADRRQRRRRRREEEKEGKAWSAAMAQQFVMPQMIEMPGLPVDSAPGSDTVLVSGSETDDDGEVGEEGECGG